MRAASLLLLVVVSLPSILCISDEMKELADMLHKTCVEEIGVDEELIEKARKGDFAEEDKLKCYMKCILDQMACVDDAGHIDEDAVIAVLPEEFRAEGERVIRKCGTKVGANACDNVFLTQKCYYQESPDSYFLV